MLSRNLRNRAGLSFGACALMLAAGIAVVGMAGCQEQPYQQATSQLNDAKSVQATLISSQKEVELATKYLTDLTAPSQGGVNSKALFDKYSSQVSRVEGCSKNNADSIVAFKASSGKYFASRASQINLIANPDVRNAADASLKDAKAKYQALIVQVDSLNADYPPLVSQLKDLRTLLGNDLSRAGLESADKVTKAAYDKANALRLKTNDVTAALDAFVAQITPESAPK